MTRIVFEMPKDEHLVLHANGSVENWVVTAEGRGETIIGTWSVEDKILIISLEGENEISFPFTFHEGQLIYPNISSQRGFWEKIE